MNSIMNACFMCTKEINCVPVDESIISQVEYLLPEITVIKLGVRLHICSICKDNLNSFNGFKQIWVENSQRLETAIKTTQQEKNHETLADITIKQEHYTDSDNLNLQSHTEDSIEDIVINDYNMEQSELIIKQEKIDSTENDPKFEEVYIPEHMEDISGEILNEETAAKFHSLPSKSKERYFKEFKKFQYWMQSINVHSVTEETVIAYFQILTTKYAPPSLITTYSMLRSTLFVFEKVDISKFKSLSSIIKNRVKGYEPKKVKTFERRDIEKFMKEAPDETFLLMKVVVLMGVMGACRCEELVYLKTTDITDNGSVLLVKIPKTKNYTPRSFVITDEGSFNGMHFFRKYAKLRPSNIGEGRFFLCYRSGRCTVQPMGINTLSKIPRLVANFLNLKDAHLYTGHCFRRTSRNFLTNDATDILPIKRWKSSSLVENYVEESVEIANKIMNSDVDDNGASSSKIINVEVTKDTKLNQISLASMSGLSNPVFNNCTINFQVNK